MKEGFHKCPVCIEGLDRAACRICDGSGEVADLKPETRIHEDLKPCPFCGVRPAQSVYPTLYVIECQSCGIRMSGHGPESREQTQNGVCWLILKQKWNRRVKVG